MTMITKEIERKMDRFPLGSQDGKGEDAEILFKVFNPYGSMRWFILEAGPVLEDGDRELFGLVTGGYEPEYGYFMLSDLTQTRVNVLGCRLPLERDLYFTGKKVSDIPACEMAANF